MFITGDDYVVGLPLNRTAYASRGLLETGSLDFPILRSEYGKVVGDSASMFRFPYVEI